MILILISWLILPFIFLPFGELTIKLFDKITKVKTFFNYSFFEKFWIGVTSIVALSIIANYFIPLNIYVLSFYLIVSIVYTIRTRLFYRIFLLLSHFYKSNKLLSWGFVLIALTIGGISLFPNYIYDNGLYHIQTMMWYEKYPIIPGLGNLHGRLAFNSTTLLLYELFNHQIGLFDTFTSISSFCILMLVGWCMSKMQSSGFVSSCILCGIYLLFIFSFSLYLASYNTDLLPALLTISVVLNFVLEDNRWKKPLFFIGIPILCMTFKLSTAPIIFLSVCYFIYFISQKEYKLILVSCLYGILLLLPWVGRFIVQTGYLIYPFPAIDIFSFDWKMPIAYVIEEKAAVVGFARIPGFDVLKVSELPLSEWFLIWYFRVSSFNSLFLIMAALSPSIFLLFYKKNNFNNIILISWLISLSGFIFSFNTAPATRFSYGFIVLSAILPFFLLRDWQKYTFKGNYLSTKYFSILVILSCIFLWVLRLFLPSIFISGQLSSDLFGAIETGFIEARQFNEWFPERYQTKLIVFGIMAVLITFFVFLYHKTKLKFLFFNLLLKGRAKKSLILFSINVIACFLLFFYMKHNMHKASRFDITNIILLPHQEKPDNPEFEKYKLDENIEFYIPIGTDCCFDNNIPCGPYYQESLRLRNKDLKKGFRIDKQHKQ